MGGFSSQSGAGNDGLGSVVNADNVCFNGTTRGECITHDGQLLIGSSTGQRVKPATLTAGTGISIVNGPNSIEISAPGSTTDYHVERFIVGDTANGATHSSVGGALGAAISAGGNQTIALQPGIYTEDFTWPPNINFVAFEADAQTPNVTIVGKASCSDAGTRSASGIRFQTNSDNFLAITGTVATVVNLENCYLNCSNATGITNSSTSASSTVNLLSCSGNIGTTGITLFSISNANVLRIRSSRITNTGSSVTNSTAANTTNLVIFDAVLGCPITLSDTATHTIENLFLNVPNTTGYTHNSTTTGALRNVTISSGTGSSISVGTGATLIGQNVITLSTNANVITGLGTYQAANHIFQGNSTYDVTTYSGQSLKGNNYHATAQGATNDSYYLTEIYGGQAYSFGLDNSDSDSFVLSASATPGTTNVMRVKSTGEINYPLQSAFLATSAGATDVTGDGTTYTIVFGNEIFDQNADFDPSTGIFTAPVTGKYQINYTLGMSQIGALHTSGTAAIVATSRTINGETFNWGVVANSGGIVRIAQSALIDMTAADTCRINITVTGSTKTVDIVATDTTFSGYLVC